MAGASSDVKVTFISDEVAADPNGFSASAQVANNAALVLGGALADGGAVTLGSARTVVITSGGDDSGISFNVVGTDLDGASLTENITGADTGAATGSKYFKTIVSITAVGDPAGTVIAGTTGSAADIILEAEHVLKVILLFLVEQQELSNLLMVSLMVVAQLYLKLELLVQIIQL